MNLAQEQSSRLVTLALLSLLEAGTAFCVLFLTKALLDREMSPHAPNISTVGNIPYASILSNVYISASLLVISSLAASWLRYRARMLQLEVVKDVDLSLSSRLLNHMVYLPVTFYDRHAAGELIQSIRNDVGGVRRVILAITSVSIEFIVITGVLISMAFVCPLGTLIGAGVVAIASIPLLLVATRKIRLATTAHWQGAHMFDALGNLLSQIRSIKVYGAAEREARRTIHLTAKYLDQHLQISKLREATAVLQDCLANIGFAGVVVLGGLAVRYGAVTWPSLILALIGLRRIYASLSTASARVSDALGELSAVRTVAQILAEPTEKPGSEDTASIVSTNWKELALQELNFFRGEAPIIKDISFVVRRGQRIAIAGPSGAGKTTLLYLIAGLYLPSSGSALLDGTPISSLCSSSYRGILSFVFQEPILTHGTIRENIAYEHTESDASIREAARACTILSHIEQLPDGFDTMIAPVGIKLSPGQQQRILLARALLKRSTLLLLDEPTSMLDTASERAVIETLHHVQRDRTIVMVTHKLHLLKHFDAVLFLDTGRVKGFAPHDDLLTNCHEYRLFIEQV